MSCGPMAIFCFAHLAAGGQAVPGWDAPTVALETISQLLIGADALQTAEINDSGRRLPAYLAGEVNGRPILKDQPFPYEERMSDAIIGHHPRPMSVALYFGGLGLAHLLAVNALEKVSPRWATVLQGITIGWEGNTVAANVRVGIRW